MKTLTRNTASIWLSLILLLILSISFLLPIKPNDYWWYVRLGEDIVNTQTIPTVDTFTYTQAGHPMVYHSWLSAVLFWVINQLGGTLLTGLVRGILLAIFYTLIWYTCRLAGAGPRLATLLALLAALAGSNNWAMRPQLFSYPLFSLTLLILWQWQITENKKQTWRLWPITKLWPIILLWPITFLWVNLHGAYVLCFLLVGAALVGGGGNRQQLAIILGGMFIIALLNPRGLGTWQYIISLLTDPPSQQLGFEWRSPTTEPWQGKLFFIWLLLFPLMVTLAKKRLSGSAWLWYLGMGWMAVSGLRYVIWFLAILAPLSAYSLASVEKLRWLQQSQRGIPLLNGLISVVLLLLPLSLLPGIRQQWWTEAPPTLSIDTPIQATEWLADHPELPGPLWSDLTFSSYLIYALPQRPVWHDTRFELFPLTQWQEYIQITEAAPTWESLLAKYNVALLMINPTVQHRLLVALEQSPQWCEQYRDETAIIFSHQTNNGLLKDGC